MMTILRATKRGGIGEICRDRAHEQANKHGRPQGIKIAGFKKCYRRLWEWLPRFLKEANQPREQLKNGKIAAVTAPRARIVCMRD